MAAKANNVAFYSEPSMPKLDHVAVRVSDLDATISFYTGKLYSINPTNANFTLLQTGFVKLDGLTVAPVDVNSAIGTIAKGTILGVRPTVDNGGTTYIYAINPVTLTQTLVHSVPLSVVDETLEFGPDGTLYGNDNQRSPGGSGWWTIDLLGSNHQRIGITTVGVWGSAIAPAAIPEASTLLFWSLLLSVGAGVQGWKRYAALVPK